MYIKKHTCCNVHQIFTNEREKKYNDGTKGQYERNMTAEWTCCFTANYYRNGFINIYLLVYMECMNVMPKNMRNNQRW